MCSTNNEGKSVATESFNRTLSNRTDKHLTAVSKNVYIDKLDDKVNQYNNAYHRTIKMKPVDVKDNAYIDSSKDVNDKDRKFTVGGHVRIWKHKNIFAKGYTPNCPEEVFVIKKVKNTVLWTYVFNHINGEEIIGTFHEKELEKTKQQKFRIEKVIKKIGDNLYVEWKGCDNSFISWIDKKDFIEWDSIECNSIV